MLDLSSEGKHILKLKLKPNWFHIFKYYMEASCKRFMDRPATSKETHRGKVKGRK